MEESRDKSILREETALLWGFLEEESEACAVVSDRMELVYINSTGRTLIPGEWFGKRCFEVLPVVNEKCAFECPTIKAVNESGEIVYCEESVHTAGGPDLNLGVAVIPLTAVEEKHLEGDPAKAVLLLRGKTPGGDENAFRAELLGNAEAMRQRFVEHVEKRQS